MDRTGWIIAGIVLLILAIIAVVLYFAIKKMGASREHMANTEYDNKEPGTSIADDLDYIQQNRYRLQFPLDVLPIYAGFMKKAGTGIESKLDQARMLSCVKYAEEYRTYDDIGDTYKLISNFLEGKCLNNYLTLYHFLYGVSKMSRDYIYSFTT